MKKVSLLVLLWVSPVAAQDYRSTCAEGRGRISNWPEVVQARDEAMLCPAQMNALIDRQRMALTHASPSVRLFPYAGVYPLTPSRPPSAAPTNQPSPFTAPRRTDR